jgi:hypothetical protein
MSFFLDLAKSCRENDELLLDLARFSEGLYEEKFVRRKYRDLLSDDDWEHLSSDDLLVEMIETRKLQRVRDGSFKREKAQQHITRGPDVLATIMDDPKANDRHRVDAIKTLDALADPGPSRFDDRDFISIRIDLAADTRIKGQEPNPNDILEFTAPVRSTNPNNTDVIDAAPTPNRAIANTSSDDPPRRKRGRPPGSKSRPKVVDTEELPFDEGEENGDAV